METRPLISTPGAILLGACIIAAAILFQGGSTQTPDYAVQGSDTTTTQEAVEVEVNLDDDPVLGSESAPVTLVEFSDYECPFCKRHFDQTYPQLKKDYIDTGKLKLVYRDFPLSFHNPLATKEAVAASCSAEQGGNSTYFKYHDEIFKRTKSNGKGLEESELEVIAKDLGLNIDSFKSCTKDEKYAAEIKKDIADGKLIGVSSTPSFYLGKSSTTSIKGEFIKGAKPYEVFKQAIDELLKK